MNQIEQLTSNLRNSILDDCWSIVNGSTGFKLISKNYEFIGSKIDWKKTKNHQTFEYKSDCNIFLDDKAKIILEALKRQSFIKTIETESKLYYISDSAIDVEISLRGCCFIDFLHTLLRTLNQHHYFVPSSGDWCMCIASEGFVDFGFATAR